LPQICYKKFQLRQNEKNSTIYATTYDIGEEPWKRKRVLIVLILSALKTKKLSAYHRLAS